MQNFHKLYKESRRSPYNLKIMLNAVIYGYMYNLDSNHKIKSTLKAEIYFNMNSI